MALTGWSYDDPNAHGGQQVPQGTDGKNHYISNY